MPSSSSHHKHGQSSKHSSSGHGHGRKQGQSGQHLPPSPTASFLFVVNLLLLDAEHYCEPDQWGVMMPPREKEGYLDEIRSPVFRYSNGRVSIAPLQWHRKGWHEEGGVISGYRQVPGAEPEPTYCKPYQTFTVFRGWKFRPVMFMASDATVNDVDEVDIMTMFHVLGFERRSTGPGQPITSIAIPRGSLYAGGRDASFVGKLVPESYANPGAQTPRSNGLAGSLPVILALMYVFPKNGSAVYRDYPGPHDAPRGVVVHICCDEMENFQESTVENIQIFENQGIVVAEG